MENINDFLERKTIEIDNKNISVNQIKKSLDIFIGKSINTVKSLKKGRMDSFEIDYSTKDHHNLGYSTTNKSLLTLGFGSILYTLNSIGFKAESLIDFSNENVGKMIDKFQDNNIADQGLIEITKFISENIIQNAELLPVAVNMTIAAGILANGMYHKNSLKRSNHVEDICKYSDKDTNEKSRVKNSKQVFLALDFHYEYKRMFYKAGNNVVQFLKDISVPVLKGIQNNIQNPILEKIKQIFGEDKYDKIGKSIKEMTHSFLKKKLDTTNKITSKDMILLMDKKLKDSKIMESTNNPRDLDIQKEISKIAQDVYESIQMTQLRKTIIFATIDYVESERLKKIEEDKSEFFNKFKIRKCNNKSKKAIETINEIRNLAGFDKKKDRLSRYTILSKVANDVFEELMKKDIKNNKSDLRHFASVINKVIKKEEKEMIKMLGSNEYYAQDLEKMLMPKTQSFEDLFKDKVEEFIDVQNKELIQKRQDSLNRIKSR
jgi:hypothetical protein